MKLARAVVSGAAWNHAGKLAEYGLLYVTSILIARSLGVQKNGEYAALLSVSSLILVVASMGLEAALNTFVPRFFGKADAAAQIRHTVSRVFLVRGVAIAGAVCIISPFFFPSLLQTCVFVGGPPGLMVLLTVMRGLIAIPVIVLTALLRTPLTSLVNVCARICELAGILLLTQKGFTLENVLLLLAVIASLQLLLYAIVARDIWLGTCTPVGIPPQTLYIDSTSHPFLTSYFWKNPESRAAFSGTTSAKSRNTPCCMPRRWSSPVHSAWMPTGDTRGS
jgi:O-antigen/teichoic acid export membrane protein